MRGQIPETVILDGRPYDLCGVRGENRLFDPHRHGITPIALTSECRRGYMSTYVVDDGALYLDEIEIGLDPRDPTGRDHRALCEIFGNPKLDEDSTPGHYDDLDHPIAFTGGLLLGRRAVNRPLVDAVAHPALRYREVVELELEDGRVVARVDRSLEIAEVREKMARPESDGAAPLPEWIESGFDIDDG